jgi:hypothetical protein
MTATGTQNRPYAPEKMMVKATFRYPTMPPGVDGKPVWQVMTHSFDWNARDEVRNFAAQSDRIIRMGGSTLLERV